MSLYLVATWWFFRRCLDRHRKGERGFSVVSGAAYDIMQVAQDCVLEVGK